MDLLDAMLILDDITWVNINEDIKLKLSPFIEDNPPILDWEGVEDNDGKLIPYSKEKAFEVLDEYKDFAALVYSYTGSRKLLDSTDKFGG